MLLEREMAKAIEKLASITVNAFLRDLHVPVKKKVFGQLQNLVDSQLPNTYVLVRTAQAQLERVLPSHL